MRPEAAVSCVFVMTESLESTINGCFLVWKRNLVLGVPFLMNATVALFLLVAYFAMVFFLLNPVRRIGAGLDSSNVNWALFLFDGMILVILLLIIYVISTFFEAGAIGMASKALETGKASIDDMTSAGRKKFLHLLAARIAIFAAAGAVGLALLIPQMIFKGGYLSMSSIAFSIIFALVEYAIVVGDQELVDGFSKGLKLFKEHKLETVYMWSFIRILRSAILLAFVILAMLIGAVSCLFLPLGDLSAEGIPKAMGPALMIIVAAAGVMVITLIVVYSCVLAPLETLFWTRFYMARTGGVGSK